MLRRFFLLFVALVPVGMAEAYASVPFPFCATLYANVHAPGKIQTLAADATWEEIHEAYKKLLAQGGQGFDAQIDARRLVNEKDWDYFLGLGDQSPWLAYGEKSLEDWQDAWKFVREGADDRPISLELLQDIHRRATRQMPFHGFEGRRAKLLLEEGKITKPEFDALLKEIYRGGATPSGVSHSALVGKLRTDPVDTIVNHGSGRKPNGVRFLDRAELEAIRANPYMSVDESSIKEFAPGQFDGKTYFTVPDKVIASAREIIDRTNKALKTAESSNEVVHIVTKMQKDLVSVHPFLDGNGRSVRLLGDLIYQRHGLPPPLYPNEADLVMSIPDSIEFARRGMVDYLNMKATKAPPSSP